MGQTQSADLHPFSASTRPAASTAATSVVEATVSNGGVHDVGGGRQNDRIDDVDDPVAGYDIAGYNVGVIHHDPIVGCFDDHQKPAAVSAEASSATSAARLPGTT